MLQHEKQGLPNLPRVSRITKEFLQERSTIGGWNACKFAREKRKIFGKGSVAEGIFGLRDLKCNTYYGYACKQVPIKGNINGCLYRFKQRFELGALARVFVQRG